MKLRPDNRLSGYRVPARLKVLWLLVTVYATSFGCAAITNPVANGLPARLVPEELLAESREGFEPTPLTLLRQQRPETYRLAAGDILGVYIDGVLGSADVPPPVNLPESAELPPSIGYPIPVREDGTITLPLVGAISVEGLTIEEVEQKVIRAFRESRANEEGAANAESDAAPPEDEQPAQNDAPAGGQAPADGADAPGPADDEPQNEPADEEAPNEGFLREENQILVTLMRPRHVRVLVIREDSPQQQVTLRNDSFIGLGTTQTTIGGGNRGIGQVLELPAYENDVLNALARTGGLPGLESTQEVIIQRGYWDQRSDPSGACAAMGPTAEFVQMTGQNRVTRIPLRLRAGQPLGFGPQDILLQNGDIVTVRGREPEFYYTGGLLPASENPLPNDYDLRVVEAVLKVRGPLFNGGLNTSNLNGAVISAGIGNPSPNLLSILRETPGGGQVTIRVDLDEAARDPRQNLLVQAGDVLILQETPDQAVTRYFTQIFRVDLFTRFLNRADATGTASLSVP